MFVGTTVINVNSYGDSNAYWLLEVRIVDTSVASDVDDDNDRSEATIM